MIGLSTVFHVAAGLAFVGLLILLGTLQKNLRFARQINRVSRRVQVDFPNRFLQRFAETFHIPIVYSLSKPFGEQRKIEFSPFATLLTDVGIRRITVNHKDQHLHVIFEVPENHSMNQDSEKLMKALGTDVTVEFRNHKPLQGSNTL